MGRKREKSAIGYGEEMEKGTGAVEMEHRDWGETLPLNNR